MKKSVRFFSKKTMYVMTLALLIAAAGFYMVAPGTIVEAQKTGNPVTKGMLAWAMNFGAAAEYSVFAERGIVEENSRIAGRKADGKDAVGAKAQGDLLNAFNVLENLPCDSERSETREGNLRNGYFTAGVYCAKTGDLQGEFVLDGNGDPNAIFIFRSSGNMRAESDFSLSFANGAEPRNVFFVAGGTVNIGEGVNFEANVVARQTISVRDGATVKGRILSVDGNVQMRGASAEGGTGVLQICKTALGEGLNDRIFRFQIGAEIYLVPVGSCSGPITLPAGPTIIDELIDGPLIPTGSWSGRFRLIAVGTDPADALIFADLPSRRVLVNVRPGNIQNQTVVEFVNTFAINAIIEICKHAARDISIADGATPIPTSNTAAALGDANIRDRDVLAGTPFVFTVDALLDTEIVVPVGQCSPAIQLNVPTAPGPVPATGVVYVTELGQVDASGRTIYRLDGAPESLAASTFPANRLLTLDFNTGLDNSSFFPATFFNPGGGIVGAQVLEGGASNQTTINFWNRSEPGYVKICKVAGFGIPIGTRFAFDVWGREPSDSPRNGTPGFPPTAPFPGNILPGVDTYRRVTVPAGPGPFGFCEFVRFGSPDPTGARVPYIVGSQVLVQEVGVAGDPRAVPIDPIPLNNLPFSIPAGHPGGVACTSATTPTNPCPQPQTNPPTGVLVSNIRLNAGASSFVSPSTISNALIPAGICTTAQGNATTNAAGSLTLNPNPSLGCRAAIFRARRGTVEVEFTNFLYRPALLKICKAGVGPGVFSLSLAQPGVSPPIAPPAQNIVVSAGSCVFAQGPFAPTATQPPVGTFNFGSVVTVVEKAFPANTKVTSIICIAGTCSAVNLNGRSANITLNATTVAGGIAVNEIIFTNEVGSPGGEAPFDFDGDGKTDVSVTRMGGSSTWYQLVGTTHNYVQFDLGQTGDIVVPADYDGDGKTQPGVFRPSTGDWWVMSDDEAVAVAVNAGAAGDIPMPSDYTGDGKADFILFRPSTSQWLRYANGSTATSHMSFGTTGDKPLMGDFDGDGKTDPAVFRPSTGTFWYAASNSSNTARATQWGTAGDIPVVADFDGDGKSDMAIFRPSNGEWWIRRSSDNGLTGAQWGGNGDRPLTGDWDGDGKADLAVFRPSNGTWYIVKSNGGFQGYQWGISSDIPSPSVYVP